MQYLWRKKARSHLQLVKLKGATMTKIKYNLEIMVVDVVFCDVLSQQEMYFIPTKLKESLVI